MLGCGGVLLPTTVGGDQAVAAVNLLLILLIWTAGALACWALILHGRRGR